jgi:hypothetical protein
MSISIVTSLCLYLEKKDLSAGRTSLLSKWGSVAETPCQFIAPSAHMTGRARSLADLRQELDNI